MKAIGGEAMYDESVDIREYPVKYPVKEKAYAIIPHNGVPFTDAAVGITYPDKDYSVSRGPCGITLFEYVVSGEGEVLIGGKWQRAATGDFYILRSGEEHVYRASSRDPWHKLWVNYVADYIGAFLSSYGIVSGIYHSDSVKRYFEELIALTKESSPNADTAFAIAERIHKIVRAAAVEKLNARDDEHGIRCRLVSYTYKKLNLDELAAELHMSKSNLIRVFKRCYGVTPYEYLLSHKIESAKVLLRETKLSVKEIADKVCIADEHYFSTVFYKRVGMRPREYRNSNMP